MAVAPGKAPGFFALVLLAFRLERIAGMRRAALIEETAEHNKGDQLQEGSLPVGGEALQKCAGWTGCANNRSTPVRAPPESRFAVASRQSFARKCRRQKARTGQL
jgi:hypothetical protein